VTAAAALAHPADALLHAFSRVGAPVCVGLDPVYERLPAALLGGEGPTARTDAIRRFSLGVVEAIAERVGCVKIQSACFERYGWPGISALADVAALARSKGLVVILDAKRGDIGVSAEHYAAASAAVGAHWTTINGYLGEDGIRPFLAEERGAFVLVRTSNPGGDAFQTLRLADGRTIFEAMADLVAELGAASVGASGYSALGAVVGATKRQDAATLRARMKRQIFLVPGYGAQGGGVDDVLPCFHADGRGAVVTASRSVLYPAAAGDPWEAAIAKAAAAFADEIRKGLGLR
jgi:orotidine-5'-phosphate decarboxylase